MEESHPCEKSYGVRKDRVNIEPAPDYEITPFHYTFVQKICGVESCLLTNLSSLYDFEPLHQRGGERAFWLEKIREVYGIDLSDIADPMLTVALLGSALEKRITFKRIEEGDLELEF